jgi:alpha-L-fucosidase
MSFSRRDVVQGAAAGLAASAWPFAAGAGAAGPFKGDWDSLAAGYRTPAWYRDAKFGIWAHWSAQCVPERGDWYGRLMYVQGGPFYEHHVKTYGHPSKFGFMEIENLWKAEHWNPEELIGLYKKAGAKYFVSLANHHDNLDTFDSTHHAWNTLRVGPKRDIVGTWAKIARREGLRFGVSNHSSHAWHWWQTAYGYDAEGPMSGVRYDAFRLTKADGKGKWWQGLDPQELYTGPSIVVPDGVTSIAAMNAWHDANDGQWRETAPPDNPAYARNWSLRCQELIDKYRPDFVYFDDYELPLGQAGLDAAAYYYNAGLRWHGGEHEVVATAKKLSLLQRRGVTEDVERGFLDELRAEPWQTCTCIGNWHYDRSIYEQHAYKSARTVVQRLCDVVSKNGNLLLSIPMRGDGTIDDDERGILADLAAWMAVNGEAIFATRPWKIYGEGPTRPATGQFSEANTKPFTPADIRFTTKPGVLYALAMDWPDGDLTIRSLASGSELARGGVERVELVGASGPLKFTQGADGLVVELPRTRPVAFTPAVRIFGSALV